MARRLAALAWLVAVGLLAGCAQPSSPSPAPSASNPSASAPVSGSAPASTQPPAKPFILQVGWDGSIPYGAWACDGAVTGSCAIQTPGAYGLAYAVPTPAGRLAGGNLTLTWTAQSPLTERMSLGAQATKPGCGDCNWTSLGNDVTGTSPLTFTIPAGAVLEAGDELRVWTYGGPYQEAGPVVVGTSGEQSFSVKGTVAVWRAAP